MKFAIEVPGETVPLNLSELPGPFMSHSRQPTKYGAPVG